MENKNNFLAERKLNISKLKTDLSLQQSGLKLVSEAVRYNYSFNFDWLSRPIIQLPQDIVAMQEIVWKVKPDLILELGIAHGGSLILSASLLAMLDLCENGEATIIPDKIKPRRVVAVDIDIRAHNKKALENHPLYPRLTLIEGSSIDPNVVERVFKEAKDHKKILICLDSNHTHDHVLKELETYAPLTSLNSYCIVYDTIIEDMPNEMFDDRPWGKNNNPKTAVRKFLEILERESRTASDGRKLKFELDKELESKLLLTSAPDGFLKRV